MIPQSGWKPDVGQVEASTTNHPSRSACSRCLFNPSHYALCSATRIIPRARETALTCSAYSRSVTARSLSMASSSRAAAVGVDLRGGDGALGQDGHDVVADLGEAAVDEVAVDVGAGLGPQLAEAEPADQRAHGRASRPARRQRAEAPRSRPIRRTAFSRASRPRTGSSCRPCAGHASLRRLHPLPSPSDWSPCKLNRAQAVETVRDWKC